MKKVPLNVLLRYINLLAFMLLSFCVNGQLIRFDIETVFIKQGEHAPFSFPVSGEIILDTKDLTIMIHSSGQPIDTLNFVQECEEHEVLTELEELFSIISFSTFTKRYVIVQLFYYKRFEHFLLKFSYIAEEQEYTDEFIYTVVEILDK